MAPDASWDNSARPAGKKGLSVLGKVLIGCGGALLCFVLAIAAGIWLVMGKVSRELDKGWAEIHGQIQSLRTDTGARTLYRANPGLAANYPTEEDFLKASAAWRLRLGDIPDKRPDFKSLVKEKGAGSFTLQSRDVDGKKELTIRMRLSNGAVLVVERENDKLIDIQVD